MNSNKRTARIAGLFFLILGIGAGINWSYFHSIYIPGDVLLTIDNIKASGWLFRLNFIGAIVSQIAFLFSAYFFYKLFKSVNKDWATLMFLLVIISVPISILNMLNLWAPLLILNGTYISYLGIDQSNALAVLFFDFYTHGTFIAQIFWGLWLFPLGFLVYRSGFIPKIIGIFLVIAGLGYLIDSAFRFLMPGYTLTLSSYTFLGELMLIFWLLIKGVKES